MPAFEAHPQARGNFGLLRRAPQRQQQVARHRVHLLLPLAQVARGPVELPKAVQDRTFDAVLGVAVEKDFLIRIVLLHRVEEPQHACVDQVVHIHVYREILVHPDGNRLHQGQVFQNHLIPQPLGDSALPSARHTSPDHVRPSFWPGFPGPLRRPAMLRNARAAPLRNRTEGTYFQ